MENLQILNENNLLTSCDNFGIIKETIYTNSLTKNTMRAYEVDIMQFFNVDRIADITIEQIKNIDSSSARQYVELLKRHIQPNGEPYSLTTINRKLTALSSFYSFLCRREIGIMDYNPFSTKEGATRIAQDKRYSNTRCLTLEEIGKIVEASTKHKTLEGMRNRIIVLLLFTTGLRREGLVYIKIGDIFRTGGKWVVEVTEKGEKPRLIVITDNIKVLIDKYIVARGLSIKDKDMYILGNHSSNAKPKEPICTNTIYRAVKALAKEAGLDESTISPHCFRHSYATESLELGIPIQDVADLLGHADVSTTRRYAHTNRIISHNPANALENKIINVVTEC